MVSSGFDKNKLWCRPWRVCLSRIGDVGWGTKICSSPKTPMKWGLRIGAPKILADGRPADQRGRVGPGTRFVPNRSAGTGTGAEPPVGRWLAGRCELGTTRAPQNTRGAFGPGRILSHPPRRENPFLKCFRPTVRHSAFRRAGRTARSAALAGRAIPARTGLCCRPVTFVAAENIRLP